MVQHNLASAACLTVSSWGENIRPGTKNGVKGAQLESVKKRETQGSICVSFQERKGGPGIDLHRQISFWNLVGGDEMDGFRAEERIPA